MGHTYIGHAAALDIGAKHFQPAAGKFIGNQHPLIVHQGGYLGGLGSGGRRRIQQHAIRFDLVAGKERRHRQHGARFLNVEEPAQVLGGVAKWDGFIAAGQPEAGITPGDRVKLPTQWLHQGDEIRDGYLQGIDPNAAAQRTSTTGHKLIHREMGRHDGRNVA